MLSSFFGGLALLLAGIGLYGVVAQAVRTRQGEIGLRMALGAQPAAIVRLVVRRVGVLIVVGLTLGLAGSVWAAQFVGPLLFQVEARDPATFVGAAGVLVAAGVLAAWLPARRAAPPGWILRRYCAKGRKVSVARQIVRIQGGCAFADVLRDRRSVAASWRSKWKSPSTSTSATTMASIFLWTFDSRDPIGHRSLLGESGERASSHQSGSRATVGSRGTSGPRNAMKIGVAE